MHDEEHPVPPAVVRADTLAAAWGALRPRGVVLLRQLNSTLDIRRLESGLAWDERLSGELHAADRSYFYRAIHLGRKR